MVNNINTQFKRGTLDMILLALIENHECNYGYSILEALSTMGGSFFSDPKPGTVYPVLSRLRKDGFIEISGTDRDGGPSRKLYTVTDKGRQKLKEDAANWKKYNKTVEGFLSNKK